MKKTYVISYDNKADVVVEIDHDVLTPEVLHEINNFWFGAEDRIDHAGGSLLKAVLLNLAGSVLAIELSNGNALPVFTNYPPEGWPKLDGSWGIHLISCDSLVIDESDMTVTCDGDEI
ncbi:MAG TPA: DUF2528 family protein [Methylobacter sp.]|jgi:hypothetical protein